MSANNIPTRSTCLNDEYGMIPNDWVEYVAWNNSDNVLHIDEFYNPKLTFIRPDWPPGGWTKKKD